MKLFMRLVLLLLCILLLLSTVDTRRRQRSRHKHRLILKSLGRNRVFSKEAVELVYKYCMTKKTIHKGYVDLTVDTEKCVNITEKRFKHRCSRDYKTRKSPNCREYVYKILNKIRIWETLLREKKEDDADNKVKQGTGKAFCVSKFQRSILYDRSSQICCGGQLIPRHESSKDCCDASHPTMCCFSCCNGTVFDRTAQFCYKRKVYSSASTRLISATPITDPSPTTIRTTSTRPISTRRSSATRYRLIRATVTTSSTFDPVVRYRTDGTRDEVNAAVKDDYTSAPAPKDVELLAVVLITLGAGMGLSLFLLAILFAIRRRRHSMKKTSRSRYHSYPAMVALESTCRHYVDDECCCEDNDPRRTTETSFITAEGRIDETSCKLPSPVEHCEKFLTAPALLTNGSSLQISPPDSGVCDLSISVDPQILKAEISSQIPFGNTEESIDWKEHDTHDQDSLHSDISVEISDLPVTEVTPLEPCFAAENFTQNFSKTSIITQDNFIENHFVTTETQTKVVKESNLRDSLGKPFQENYTLSVTDRVVQLPHSDVVMTLPGKDLQKANIQCHVSSLTDVAELNRKLRLTEDEHISSPVIEYILRGVSKLEEYAVIKLPVCSDMDNIRIVRAESDQGASESFDKMHDVPRVNTREEGSMLDTFYVTSDNKPIVYIYTKVFSVYLNIETGQKIDFQTHAYLFGGLKKCGNQAIVTTALYAAGWLSGFSDYETKMLQDERRAGRKQIDKRELKFKGLLRSTDTLQVAMDITNVEEWDFVKDEVKTKMVEVRDIVQCQRWNGFENAQLCWEAENRVDFVPACFRASIRIDHIHGSTGQTAAGTEPLEQEQETTEPVCRFTIMEDTQRERRRRQQSSGNSSLGSSSSVMDSQSSIFMHMDESVQVERENPVLVRKETDTSTMPSYYDNRVRRQAPTNNPRPLPELSTSPEHECSYNILGNRAVGEYRPNTL